MNISPDLGPYCLQRFSADDMKSTESEILFFISQGNKAVVKSIDEYSISVEGQRGLKEFQYDQVFMEDSTQEKIFEDTNVSLSSQGLKST